MKSLAFVLFTLMIFAAPVFAANGNCTNPSGRAYVSVSNVGDQLVFKGQNFCDSSFFKIRVSNDYNGTDGWYVSNSGNTQWEINQSGSFSMTFAKRYLKPGNLLQLVTYNSYSRATHTFSKAIPCELQRVPVLFTDGFSWYEGAEVVLNCGQTPAPEPVQACSVRVVASNYDAGVNVSCDLIDRDAYISVIDRHSRIPLCRARFRTTNHEVRVCSFSRNPNQKLVYELELQSAGKIFASSDTIYKDGSWNSAPEGEYLSANEMAPAPKNKSRKGKRWEANISVRVVDRDVDSSEGRALIDVELVNVASGAVVETKSANSGETVTFKVYREFVNPWIGKEHFKGVLLEGENHFQVRVKDAYSNAPQAMAPLVLPTVNVRVN